MGGQDLMNLENASRENIEFIVNSIVKQLAVVNASILRPEDFGSQQYEELLDIYHMIHKKRKLTISELDAILVDLGKLRKK
jgi:uncharacterized protein YfkK (UPF0435 family)